jgi:guanyl-specific ribonuclease Sa
MNKLRITAMFALAALLSAMITACSGEKAPQEQAQQTTQQNTQQQSQPQSQQQAHSQPAPAANPAAASDPYQLPKNGKVIKAMHAGGYTYMQIEKDGKEFWIASTMLNVKRDDYVRWADAAVMKNFSSSTLHKTFDEILFVTNAELDQ